MQAAGEGQFGIGVVANGTFAGVQAIGDDTWISGRGKWGADLGGTTAPLLLRAAPTAGAPQAAGGAHLAGELYVDANGDLYLCKAGGTPGTWVKIG